MKTQFVYSIFHIVIHIIFDHIIIIIINRYIITDSEYMFCKSLLKITELKANSYGYLVVSSEVAVSYQVSFPKKLPRCFLAQLLIIFPLKDMKKDFTLRM